MTNTNEPRLPAIYLDASAHGVMPVCPLRQRLGVAFVIEGQAPVRIALDERAARFYKACLDDYLAEFAGNQSDKSSLMPSAAVSVPSEGVKV